MPRDDNTYVLHGASSLATWARTLTAAGFSAGLHRPPDGKGIGLQIVLPAGGLGHKVPLFMVLMPCRAAGVSPATQSAQFISVLPFRIHKSQLGNTVKLVVLLNSLAPMPGFGIEPTQRLVTFRHAVLVRPDSDDTTIVDNVHSLSATVQTYGPLLRGLASRELSFEAAFRAAHQAGR